MTVSLPEPPAAYQYLFDGYYGEMWRNDSASWNGNKPKASRTLHTADQMHAHAAAVSAADNAALRERVDTLTDLLILAQQGLLWYQDTCPEVVNGCDDEVMTQIAAALKETSKWRWACGPNV